MDMAVLFIAIAMIIVYVSTTNITIIIIDKIILLQIIYCILFIAHYLLHNIYYKLFIV